MAIICIGWAKNRGGLYVYCIENISFFLSIKKYKKNKRRRKNGKKEFASKKKIAKLFIKKFFFLSHHPFLRLPLLIFQSVLLSSTYIYTYVRVYNMFTFICAFFLRPRAIFFSFHFVQFFSIFFFISHTQTHTNKLLPIQPDDHPKTYSRAIFFLYVYASISILAIEKTVSGW